MTRSFILLCILTLSSCSDINDNIPTTKMAEGTWDKCEVKLGDKKITTFLSEDTCYFFEIFYDDTLYAKQHKKFRSDSKKFVLKRNERDTLFKYARKAILDPVITDRHVSDYAGEYVSVSLLNNSKTKITCSYGSVYHWQTISPALAKVDSLTFGRLSAK